MTNRSESLRGRKCEAVEGFRKNWHMGESWQGTTEEQSTLQVLSQSFSMPMMNGNWKDNWP